MKKILEFIKAIIPHLNGSFDSFKKLVIDLARKETIKLAMAKLAKGFLKGAVGNWFIAFAVEYLFDEFVIPLMEVAFNYMGYQFERVEGKIKIKKLIRARGEGNVQEYDVIVDDIIG